MFIVFSYEYSGIGGETGGLVWLPIVSNKHAPRMKSHSVRIHVSPGTTGYKDLTGKGKASMQSAIFLARDLEAFCLVMTMAGLSCTQTNLAVTLYANGPGKALIDRRPGSFNNSKVTAPQFKCELRNTRYRQIDAATQRQLLAPMARILAPSQRVSFKGIVCDLQEVERLKETMSPTLNCFQASKWAFFEGSSLAKDLADTAVSHDDIDFVLSLYHLIAVTLGVCAFTHLAVQSDRRIFLYSCPEAAEACDILILEAWVNVACCAVKAKDMQLLARLATVSRRR